MTKQEFVERAIKLSEYDKKECELEKILNIGCENFLIDIINEMGDMLITAVNPDLEGSGRDYFYEIFWDNLNKYNKYDWGIFYDLLIDNNASSKYIERYS